MFYYLPLSSHIAIALRIKGLPSNETMVNIDHICTVETGMVICHTNWGQTNVKNWTERLYKMYTHPRGCARGM
jgi:hypothetical protein